MGIMTEFRIAVRRLIREPLFTIVAVTTLAVGIGANSAIFTLVNGIMLRPLSYAEPDALVHVHATVRGERIDVFSIPVFLGLREHGRAFADVALINATSATLATGDGEPEQITGAVVSANYFDVVGVPPLRGRTFREGENSPGNEHVVVLSEGLWRERFGGTESMIGSTIDLNGRSSEVIGVMPAHASVPPDQRFWIPVAVTESMMDPRNVLALSWTLVGRLAPGTSLEQASADVARVVELAKEAAQLEHPYYSGAVRPLHDHFVGEAGIRLLVLMGAVGLVLLIVCANIANLMLAQATSRWTDFAVRRSLGATTGQLVRQLLTESLVLGLVGASAGLVLGMWATDALVALVPAEMPRASSVRLDGTVVLFTFAISIIAALLFGLAPALQVRRDSLSAALREGGRGLAGRSGGRTRAGLVLAETALAFALLIGAGLLIRSLGELQHVNPGFSADRTLSFQVSLPNARYDAEARMAAAWEQLMDRVAAVPGVQSAGAIQHMPLGGGSTTITFTVEGRPEPPPGEETVMDVRIVTPAWFETMGVPLLSGRVFTDADRADGIPVAVLSEAAAARHFPGEDPIGRRILMGWSRFGRQVTGEVIGVVGSVRNRELRSAPEPEIYFPAAQQASRTMAVAVRAAAGDPMALAGAVKAAVHEVDPGLAVAQLRPLSSVVAESVAADRFMARLLTAFSAVALLLAAVGIFGVISYSVAQRRREIGVRMAVGASRGDVVRLIVTGAIRLAGAGVLLGVIGALAASRLLQSLLFGVRPSDPVTFVASGVVLLGVALVASVLPAWTAARTPPASVLNTE